VAFDAAARSATCAAVRHRGSVGLWLRGLDTAVAAAGALIDYCRHTQQSTLPHVTGCASSARASSCRWMRRRAQPRDHRDARRRRIADALLALDRCSTSMGSRRLRHGCTTAARHPALRERQARSSAGAPELALAHPRLRELFAPWADVERITARWRCAPRAPRDLSGLRDTLATSPTCTPRCGRGIAGLDSFASALAPDAELHDASRER
jgi:DNA mismatch repair protein MutS